MGKIYVLLGQSSSGKTTIEQELLKQVPKLKQLISTVTRPMRQGEAQNNPYHFVDDDTFKTLIHINDLLEYTYYNTNQGLWFYGTSKSVNKIDLTQNDYIKVINPQGLRSLLHKVKRDDVYVIYIETSDKTRLLRSLTREENPDCKEICRRFTADAIDFDGIETVADLIIDNEKNTLEQTVQIIKDIIERKGD